MKISQMVKILQGILEEEGDLPVVDKDFKDIDNVESFKLIHSHLYFSKYRHAVRFKNL